MDDKPVRPKRTKVHPILLSLYFWYTSALVQAKFAKNILMYYSGIYMPLWLITVLVGYHRMDSQVVENEDGEKCLVKFQHIEYSVSEMFTHLDLSPNLNSDSEEKSEDDSNGEPDVILPSVINWKYTYDITARSLWYLNFIDDTYSGFMQYARACLPFDLQEHKFNHPTDEVSFKYIITKKDTKETPSYGELVINNQELYHSKMNNLCSGWSGIMYNTLKFL